MLWWMALGVAGVLAAVFVVAWVGGFRLVARASGQKAKRRWQGAVAAWTEARKSVARRASQAEERRDRADRREAQAEARAEGSQQTTIFIGNDIFDRRPLTLLLVFWLVIAMAIVYVGHFEANYRLNAACRRAAQWTRVVFDPSLPGMDEPIIEIGSNNADSVIVISGAECKAGKTNAPPAPIAGRDGGHPGDVLLDLWREVNGRVRFLWRDKSSDGDLPQAVVVPLSRVLCMYYEPANPANGTDDSSPCTARNPRT